MGMALASLDEEAIAEGIGFDGSSIRGFQEIYESDMLLLPDPSTAILDPFYEARTISLVCTVLDPITREPYTRDPRYVAIKAEEHLRSGGVADVAYFGPEAEFYVFDHVAFDQQANTAFYEVAVWASWGAAIAAVLVLAVVGVWALGVQSRADEATRRDAIVSAAITAISQPGSSIAVLRPSGTGTTSGTGFAAVSADGTAYVVMVGVPEAPSGRIYQAWFIRDNQPSSAGLMTVDRDGYAVLTNASPPAGAQVIALTVEPAGGSALPTSDPFALGEVRSV
jgi:anti-sigma-K factor RskA